VVEAARDARCHELALQWTHHISQTGRESVANMKLALPLLPERGEAEHLPELRRIGNETHAPIAKLLTDAVTCQIGHEAKQVERGTWEGFPHWPYEVTYNASGYGP
jgi:hypothetical protein